MTAINVFKDPCAPGDDAAGTIRSVAKACAVLEMLRESQRPLRITDLARRLNVSKSNVSRLVSTLAAAGLVEQDGERGYCYLGLGLAVLGNAAVGRRELDRIAHRVMSEIAARTNEQTGMGRLQDGHVVIVRTRPDAMRDGVADVIAVAPVHACAGGKVLLAGQSDETVTALLKRIGMPPHTPRTITSIDEYLRQLTIVRETGFAVDDGELVEGLRHIACPVQDHGCNVVAAISSIITGEKLSGKVFEQRVSTIQYAAFKISHQLGCENPADWASRWRANTSDSATSRG